MFKEYIEKGEYKLVKRYPSIVSSTYLLEVNNIKVIAKIYSGLNANITVKHECYVSSEVSSMDQFTTLLSCEAIYVYWRSRGYYHPDNVDYDAFKFSVSRERTKTLVIFIEYIPDLTPLFDLNPQKNRKPLPKVLSSKTGDKKEVPLDVSKSLLTIKEIISMFMQSLCILSQAWVKYKFVHGDLHMGNIAIIPCDKDLVIDYDNGYSIPTYGNKIIILDFGLSSINMETYYGEAALQLTHYLPYLFIHVNDDMDGVLTILKIKTVDKFVSNINKSLYDYIKDIYTDINDKISYCRPISEKYNLHADLVECILKSDSNINPNPPTKKKLEIALKTISKLDLDSVKHLSIDKNIHIRVLQSQFYNDLLNIGHRTECSGIKDSKSPHRRSLEKPSVSNVSDGNTYNDVMYIQDYTYTVILSIMYNTCLPLLT